jgi:hypothetical protein
MRGDDIDLDEMLGPDPLAEEPENLVDAAPPNIKPKTSGRALLERAARYPVNRAASKCTPENLNRALAYAREMPVGGDVARRLGISYTTLKYWLQSSLEGTMGDRYDIPSDDGENTTRFHVAWDDAMLVGAHAAEKAMIKRATGYEEVLIYKGRVQYKYDPKKLALSRELGLPEEVPENYLVDQFGAPVPETVEKQDPDLVMFFLKAKHPDYKAKPIDVNVRGGVLVVGMKIAAPEDLNLLEEEYRRVGTPLVTFDEDEDGS